MRSFWLLWSAILRMAKQTISAWRAVVVGLILCLTVVAGCDVRPFSELFGHDTEEENGADDGETDDGETPDSTELELNPDPDAIVTPVNMPATVQVNIDNRESGRTYTYETTTPNNGEAQIDTNGLLTFTPSTSGTSSLVVTVEDDGEPARSGTITIPITVNPG